MKPILKLIAIISYLSIVFMGSMIGLPLCLWMVFSLLYPGDLEFYLALSSLIGLILNLVIMSKAKFSEMRSLDVLAFIFLLCPIIYKIIKFPIVLSQYYFLIPFFLFIVSYVLFLSKSFPFVNQPKK